MGEVERFVALMIAAATAAVVARWIRLPYSIALLLLGIGLGLSDILSNPRLSSDVILLLFLPPLIFEAVFVLDLHLLWDVRFGVFAFAVPGVLLAMTVGGALVHWGMGLPWSIALLFGAIIAATDPVAVLATFRQLSVAPRLSTLLEGESLFNDGVALVLLATLVQTVDVGFRPGATASTFLLEVVGGTVLGLALGWIGHWVIGRIAEHLTEMIVSVAVAYGAFLAADELQLSGVMATIAAAMMLGHLGRARSWVYSDESARFLIDLWEFLAFLANAALFLLIGLTVRTAHLREHPEAVIWGIVAALVGRAIVAYGIGSLLDRQGFTVTRADRHVLFWGGLRGAVALAAVLSLPEEFPYYDQLLAMTFSAVLFTLLVQGLTIGPLVRRLGLQGAAPPA